MEKEPKRILVKDIAQGDEDIEKKSNIVELETSSAKYNIIYSLHNIPTKPEVIKDSTDGVIFELIGNYQTSKTAEQQADFLLKRSPYQQVIKLAAKKQKPIYLVDLSMDARTEHSLNLFYKKTLLPVIEVFAASGLIFSGIK